MKNLPLLLATIVGTLVLVFGVAFMFSNQTSVSNEPVDPAVVEGSKRNVKGAENAAVTVVEFSDFQCPACRAAAPAVEQVLTQYPDQVQVVYRHFPLVTIHQRAQLAAQASEVVAEYGQDKFWAYHDQLFVTQDQWGEMSAEEATQAFADYAVELEIDRDEFLAKIQSEDVKNRVARDVSDATRLNVQATPTFYVNGTPTTAPQLLSTVASALQASDQASE